VSVVFFSCVLLVALFMTQSRGPLLALLVCLMFSFFFSWNYTKHIVIAVFMSGVGVVSLLYYSGYDLVSLFMRKDASRLSIWSSALDSVYDNPIIGRGLIGSTDVTYLFSQKNTFVTVFHPHNLYIEILMLGGLVGFVFFMALICRLLMLAYKMKQTRYGLTIFLLLIFSLVIHVFDNVRLIASPGVEWLLFWVPVGMAMALEGDHVDLGHHPNL